MAFTYGIGGDDDPVLADINVTPLVDVMLVLLIIFMIAAPMLHQGVEVALPRADATNLPIKMEDPLVLRSTGTARSTCARTRVAPEDLVDRVKARIAARGRNGVPQGGPGRALRQDHRGARHPPPRRHRPRGHGDRPPHGRSGRCEPARSTGSSSAVATAGRRPEAVSLVAAALLHVLVVALVLVLPRLSRLPRRSRSCRCRSSPPRRSACAAPPAGPRRRSPRPSPRKSRSAPHRNRRSRSRQEDVPVLPTEEAGGETRTPKPSSTSEGPRRPAEDSGRNRRPSRPERRARAPTRPARPPRGPGGKPAGAAPPRATRSAPPPSARRSAASTTRTSPTATTWTGCCR